MPTRAERVKVALALREKGLIYREIAAEMGISTSYASGLVLDPEGKDVWKRKHRARCVDCGDPCDTSGARHSKRCQRCAREHERVTKTIWTRERIIEAIQRWARERGEPPTSTEWLRPGKPPWAPAVSIVQTRFGSWSAAMRAAGFRSEVGRSPVPL